jgi:hypothetical protein
METRTGVLRTEEVTLSDVRKFAERGRLYAILDACDAPTVPVKVKELGNEQAVSLYRGSAEEEYWAIAPYLVRVDGILLDWLHATLWKEPWGIFVVANSDIETLRKHFRRFLVVELPDGGKSYFRYYDSRVLQEFLPSCVREEVDDIFGSLTAFGTTDSAGDKIVLWRQ